MTHQEYKAWVDRMGRVTSFCSFYWIFIKFYNHIGACLLENSRGKIGDRPRFLIANQVGDKNLLFLRLAQRRKICWLAPVIHQKNSRYSSLNWYNFYVKIELSKKWDRSKTLFWKIINDTQLIIGWNCTLLPVMVGIALKSYLK